MKKVMINFLLLCVVIISGCTSQVSSDISQETSENKEETTIEAMPIKVGEYHSKTGLFLGFRDEKEMYICPLENISSLPAYTYEIVDNKIIATGCSNGKIEELEIVNETTVKYNHLLYYYYDGSDSISDDFASSIEKETESTTMGNESGSYMTTEGFYPISSIVDSYILDIKYINDTSDDGIEFTKKIFYGEYALSSGEKDTITVVDYGELAGSYIEINSIREEIFVGRIQAVGFLDMDERDEYKEVVVYYEGAKAMPAISLYRLCDNDIHIAGYFSGEYEDILFNKKGRVVDTEGHTYFIEPEIVTKYFEVSDNTVEFYEMDYSAALNKTYKLSRDIEVVFCEMDYYNPEDARYDINDSITLKKGDELHLIEINTFLEEYYVQLSDGRKGVFVIPINFED